MYKLILHHTYKLNGEAVDITDPGYGNHGFSTSVTHQPNGVSAGSGTVVFSGGPSRIRVTNKPVWQNLRSIKIEMWVKVNSLGQRRNLVEGDLCFAFFIHPDGVLWGTFYDPGQLSPPTTGSDPSWPGANSDTTYAPDNVRRTVPLNTWVKLTYEHDGISCLRLYINDALVGANYSLRAPVTSVQPSGVHIGHWPGDDRYTFDGQIDDIQIWKYDPDVSYKQFFCRPMDKAQMDCWRIIFDGMADRLDDHELRTVFINYMRCIWSAQEFLVRAIFSKGEAAIKKSDDFSQRYQDLWCSGQIDGNKMKDFFNEWLAWLYELLGKETIDEFRNRIESCQNQFPALKLDQIAPKDLAKCDPSFAAYLKLMEDIYQAGPKLPSPSLIEQIAKWIGYIIGLLGRIFKRG